MRYSRPVALRAGNRYARIRPVQISGERLPNHLRTGAGRVCLQIHPTGDPNLIHAETEALRAILENIHHPEMLDSHPWVSRLFVKEAVARRPELGQAKPGCTTGRRAGGFLCENHPIQPAAARQTSRHALGRIRSAGRPIFCATAIWHAHPHFPARRLGAHGSCHPALRFRARRGFTLASEIAAYKLVGDELEVAPTSTLSDWHTKGMQKLAEALSAHEQFLTQEQPRPRPRRRLLKAALLILLLATRLLSDLGRVHSPTCLRSCPARLAGCLPNPRTSGGFAQPRNRQGCSALAGNIAPGF